MLSNKLPSVQKNEYEIAIVGVGEGGIQNVNCMIDSGVWDVNFITVHGYSMTMDRSKANTKIFIGENMPKGLGMLASPELCERLAVENKEAIKDCLRGASKVIIVAGLGGNMGTGATSVIADCAHEVGATAIALVTVPFEFEGTRRRKKAKEAVYKLKNHADNIIVLPLDNLLNVVEKRTSITKALYYANYSIMLVTGDIVDELKSIKFALGKDKIGKMLPLEGIVEFEFNIYGKSLFIESEKDIDVKIIEGSHLKYLELNNPPTPTMGLPSYIPRDSDTNTPVDSEFIDIPGWMWKHPPKKQELNKEDAPHIDEERRPRSDGRQLCSDLREMRVELAEANNIPFESKECDYDGPCSGTCPKCDEEAAYLRDKLAEIPADERKYPDRKIREMVDII